MATQIGEYTLVGSDPASVRAEARLEFDSCSGLRERDVILYLDDLYKAALKEGKVSVRFTPGGDCAAASACYNSSSSHAPTLVLVTVKSPRWHAKLTVDEWLTLVRRYLLQAAAHVGQFRVQLAHWPVEVEVYERNKNESSQDAAG